MLITTREAIRDEVTATTIYRGDVTLTQGTLRIDADEVTIEASGREAERVVATGRPARVEQLLKPGDLPVQAAALRITYLRSQGLMRLRGDCALAQGDTTLTSARIDYDMNAQTLRAFSNPETGRRVTSVIEPAVINDQ